jgi:cysteine desulfuration protein SufE
MRFPALAMPGVPGVLVGFVHDLEPRGVESPGQLFRDAITPGHGLGITGSEPAGQSTLRPQASKCRGCSMPAELGHSDRHARAVRRDRSFSPAAIRSLYHCAYISAMRQTMTASSSEALTTLDEILDNFSLLEEWDDRYRYVIELGRGLSPLPERERTEANKVQGCASQVWLATSVHPNGAGGPVLTFSGDSDAHIVRGLIAILFAIFSGKRARDILSMDAIAIFERLGLREHLTPQRSNGFRSMVERIRADARAATAA